MPPAGETGNWNGEDIIRIIAKQPATARFISRHLYNFFVADEPPVPAWQHTTPRDPEAIKQLEDEYFRSDYDLRSMLRLLFNSEFSRKLASPRSRARSRRWLAPRPWSAISPSPSPVSMP